jgi:hypothetical protein
LVALVPSVLVALSVAQLPLVLVLMALSVQVLVALLSLVVLVLLEAQVPLGVQDPPVIQSAARAKSVAVSTWAAGSVVCSEASSTSRVTLTVKA